MKLIRNFYFVSEDVFTVAVNASSAFCSDDRALESLIYITGGSIRSNNYTQLKRLFESENSSFYQGSSGSGVSFVIPEIKDPATQTVITPEVKMDANSSDEEKKRFRERILGMSQEEFNAQFDATLNQQLYVKCRRGAIEFVANSNAQHITVTARWHMQSDNDTPPIVRGISYGALIPVRENNMMNIRRDVRIRAGGVIQEFKRPSHSEQYDITISTSHGPFSLKILPYVLPPSSCSAETFSQPIRIKYSARQDSGQDQISHDEIYYLGVNSPFEFGPVGNHKCTGTVALDRNCFVSLMLSNNVDRPYRSGAYLPTYPPAINGSVGNCFLVVIPVPNIP
jgi:hypothetical protein